MTFNFTKDWHSANIPVWETVLSRFKDRPTQVIEIGSFEGMSTVWFCENILKHPDSHIDCVDPYLPYLGKDLDMVSAKSRFLSNTAAFKDKITLHEEKSDVYLKRRIDKADIIYIDGDHTAKACLTDMVQSHMLLNPDGLMIVDDYLWAGLLEGLDVPKSAVNSFMAAFAEEYKLVSIGYQIILRKNVVK